MFRVARTKDPQHEPGLPFSYREYLLMWSDDDKLMLWNQAAKDWIEAPIGLSVAVRNAPEWRRQRRRGLLRDSVAIGLLLSPFAALTMLAPSLLAGSGLGYLWFFLSLVWMGILGYWVIRSRS